MRLRTLKAAQSILDRWRFKGWILLGTALVSFAAGSLCHSTTGAP